VSVYGIGPRDVLALARDARGSAGPTRPLLVTGVLAEQLARELAAGGDRALVRTSGEPAGAAALVRVVAGAATREDERQLRAATRALVPVVAVQTGISSVRLPYVFATDIVECPPGSGFPVDEIVGVLARVLGSAGPPLGARLPVLRAAVERHVVASAAVAAGALAALTRDDAPRLPVLALAQARMLSDLSTARGAPPSPEDLRAAAQTVAPPLAAAVGVGLLARAVVRRLPVRNRLLEGVVAASATFVLAELGRAAGSVRSGS
jgi:uncharacterized protein (DUF697 family)